MVTAAALVEDQELADIAGWAHAGYFDIVTGGQQVVCGSEDYSGLVAVSVMDILEARATIRPQS